MSGERRGLEAPRARPPDAAFFQETDPTPRGPLAAVLEMGTLAIGLEGMDEPWHRAFLARYGPFARAAAGDDVPTLGFAASTCDREYFIAPPPPGTSTINPLAIAVDPDPDSPDDDRIRACTYGLAASFTTAGGEGRLIFARGRFDPRERGVENILRVATAWLAVSRGGLLLHSASIIKDDRAYLFFGQSGAGKSTLAASSRRGTVVSDDLTLLLPGAGGGPHVAGTPFRGTFTRGDPVLGRFPVRAAFRLQKAAPEETTQVTPIRPALARAEAIANLPFLVDQLHVRPGLFDRIDAVLSAFPIRALRVHKGDTDFWDAIAAAGL